MVRSVRSLVVIGALFVAACGSGGSGEAAGSATAGTVVEVAGEVTAVRAAAGSTPRALATGTTVYADDTITTAAEATITIELTHNGARWSLTGGVSRRVDRSPAWRAAKRGGDSLLSASERDRTAAAGRHAERSAAETTGLPPEAPAAAAPAAPIERAPAAPALEYEAEPEPPGAVPPPPPAPEPPPRDAVKEKRAKRSSSTARRVGGSTTKGFRPPVDDAVDDLVVVPETKAADKLTREQVLAAVSRMRKALAACAAAHAGDGQTVTVEFVVAPDGRPRTADAQSPHAGTPLGRCVEAAIKKTRFPPATQDTPVTFPFRL